MVSLSTSSCSKKHLFQSCHCFPVLSVAVTPRWLQEGCISLILKHPKYQDPFGVTILYLKQKLALGFSQLISWLLSSFPNCLYMSPSWCAGSAKAGVCVLEKKMWAQTNAKPRCKHASCTVGSNGMQEPAWLHLPICSEIIWLILAGQMSCCPLLIGI